MTLHVNALVNPGPERPGPSRHQQRDTKTYVTHVPLWQTPAKGVQDMGYVVKVTAQTLGQVIAGKLALSQAVQGPVGIVTNTGEVAASARSSVVSLFFWSAR